jgi:DnaK suppressor protein
MVSKAKAPAKAKSAAKGAAKTVKPVSAKAKPAAKKAVKAPAKAPVKAPAKAPVKAPVKAPAKALKPAPAKPAAAVPKGKGPPKVIPKGLPAIAKGAAPAKPGAGKGKSSVTAVPAPSPTLAAPVPKTAARPVHSVSPKDLAAAHEYLLSRSSTRSEEPVIVNGQRLPTEGELLAMPEDQYMNEAQLAYFKHRLQQMERELLSNADETTEHLRETVIVPDPADRATIEEEHALELRTRDRERKLLKKVQSSLASIDSGEYGFCEETGDPIGIPRLLARPTATLSLEAQQRREMKQKLFGD